MIAQNVAFGLIAAAMALSAIGVVRTRNVVHAALFLVVVLAGGAAQYILLGAEFLAWVQVLIYIGAVIVLFLFGIMLTRAPMRAEEDMDNDLRWPGAVVALFLFGTLATLLWQAYEDVEVAEPLGGLTEPTPTIAVADSVFREHVVALEVVGILLTAALIGAVALARRD